jgi:hypothetical protein
MLCIPPTETIHRSFQKTQRYLLTSSTPTIARTRGLLLPAQYIHLFEGFCIKIV